jgi:hypothetical protein
MYSTISIFKNTIFEGKQFSLPKCLRKMYLKALGLKITKISENVCTQENFI